MTKVCEVETGTLIAAVGNIETKAASYIVMPSEIAVSPSGLKTLVEERQEPDNVRRATPNVYGNYCSTSFVQVGLVAKEYNDRGHVRYKSTAEPRALALAGAMLDFSLPLDLSLRQLWAATGSPDKAKLGSQEARRGTHARLGIFATLTAHDGTLTNGFIVQQKQLEYRSVSLHLKDLDRLGIVDYNAFDGKKIDPLYVVNQGDNAQNDTQSRIVEILIAASEPLPRSELVARLGHYASKHSAQAAMHKLTARMVDNGTITVTNGIKRDEFSEVTLKPEWREVIQDLVDRVNAIEQGVDTAIQSWKARGEEILDEPPLLTKLMHKSFDTSGISQARSGVRPTVGQLVENHLVEHGPSTSEQLLAAFPDINGRSVFGALHGLRNKGRIAHPTENIELWCITNSN